MMMGGSAMLLLGKHVESITSADILRLVEEGIPESRSLDYKRDLLGNRDKDKKEFLADVSSFANTGGGVIIFGIDEQRDEDGGNTGVPFRILGIGDTSPDEAIRRMDNIIRDGLDPVLDGGVIIRGVPIGDDTVLVVGIPRSVMAPHMVIFKNHGRFYGRASAGRFQMDVRQLRSSLGILLLGPYLFSTLASNQGGLFQFM
jgi:predicted HTH transcriptional regulator